MAIQMRRGLRADFDPAKMRAGEWAVAIDSEIENQIVWMCFSAGIVKRMGTYEDFAAQIQEISGDLVNRFKQELTAAQEQLQNKTETYIQGKVDDELVPELQALVTKASTSEKNAAGSAEAAKMSENESKTAQAGAEKAKTDAETAKKESETARDDAKTAKAGAEAARDEAEASKTASATSVGEAEKWRKWSESYAHGGTGVRPEEDTDNSEYWYQQTKQISQGKNGIVDMGNIEFKDLASVDKVVNHMYNVTDEFTSDDTFNDGGGVHYGAGNNVVWTGKEKWDVLAASAVNGIKGNNEAYYQQGNYEITPGKLKLDTFVVAAARAQVQAGDSLPIAFGKLAKYCADLQNVAFSNDYNDLDNKPSVQDNLISSSATDPLSARQGNLLANGSARDSTKVLKTGDTMTGTLRIANAGTKVFDDGIRLQYADNQWIDIMFGGTANTGTGENVWGIFRNASNDFLVDRNGNSGQNGFIIKKSGNMGLGTTNPSVKLDVVGAVKASGGFTGNLTGKATSAGTADSVAWTGVTNKPDFQSQIDALNSDLVSAKTEFANRYTYTCFQENGSFTFPVKSVAIVCLNRETQFGLYLVAIPAILYAYPVVAFPGVSFTQGGKGCILSGIPIYSSICVLT